MDNNGPSSPEKVATGNSGSLGGNQRKTDNPSARAVGFPSDAVEALRDGQRQLDMEGVEVGVSRQAVDEVLSWIDRYVPRPVQSAESAVVVDGVQELRIDGDELFDRVELIRCNGRVFVPEVVEIEEHPSEREIGRELIRLARTQSHAAAVLSMICSAIEIGGTVTEGVSIGVRDSQFRVDPTGGKLGDCGLGSREQSFPVEAKPDTPRQLPSRQ